MNIPEILPYYGTRYIVSDQTRTGTMFEVLIKERNYIGDATTIRGYGTNPVRLDFSYLDKDFFNPVAGSSCRLSLYTDTYDGLINLAKGDDTKYVVEVYDGDMIFRGFLKPQTYTQEYGPQSPSVKIEATDGLGLLRDIPFRPDDNPTRGVFTLKDIISYVLYLAGNRTDWYDLVSYESNIIQENKNIYGSFSHQIFNWFDRSCYEVLTEILSMFEAQILSVKGSYYIRLVDEPEAPFYDKYDYQGNLTETGPRTATKKDLYNDYEGAYGSVEIDRPLRKNIVTQTKNPIENLIYNGSFDEGTDGWEGAFSVSEGVATISGTDYIRQSFDRGVRRGTPVRLGVKIRARNRGLGQTWRLQVTHANQTLQSEEFTRRDSDGRLIGGWEEIDTFFTTGFLPTERMFYLDTIYEEPDIKIYGVGVGNLDISDVQVRALKWDTQEPFERKEGREVTVINEHNLSDKINQIQFLEGDPHIYKNALNIDPLFRHRTGFRVGYFEFLKSRYDAYHRKDKVRLNLQMYNKDHILNGLMLVYDRFLKLDYLVTSMVYDVKNSVYNAELVSYQEDIPAEELVWILAGGYWNDQGQWIDAESWNDGSATYSVTFIAVDAQANAVNNYLVNICCPSNTIGSGVNNEVTFSNKQIDTYTYTAFKDGYQEVTGTFEIVDQDLTINITFQ